jgi:tetratricopeptide (TPR) repeat protein
MSGAALLVVLVALLVSPPAGAGPVSTPEVAAELARLEQALAAAPESLERGDAYRRAALAAGEHDRAIAFLERLAAERPEAPALWLNFGYAYVDKIPAAGAITRALLANSAVRCFTRALELERSWLALYTRGNSYLYWPRIFGRGPLAVADLEEAVALSRTQPPRRVHGRAYLALGDAYWRTEQPEQARAAWTEGRERFPGEPGFGERLGLDAEALEAYIYERLDPGLRVDTDLRPLWEEP